jgi:hypothetical protein
MSAPSAAELLTIWERSAAYGPLERAGALLGEPAGDLALGEKNARLLELRQLLFGTELDAVADCERCGETVEFTISAERLLRERRVDAGDVLELQVDDYEVSFRVPTAGDLAAAARERDLDGARAVLLERCLRSPSELPEPVVAALAERMADADPLADVRLDVTCPECGHAWAPALDVGDWLWNELDAWAHRTLRDVHALASAYGWSEAEILALGPRRELYLDLLSG